MFSDDTYTFFHMALTMSFSYYNLHFRSLTFHCSSSARGSEEPPLVIRRGVSCIVIDKRKRQNASPLKAYRITSTTFGYIVPCIRFVSAS